MTRQAGDQCLLLVENLSSELPLHWDMRESISLSFSSTDRRRELRGNFTRENNNQHFLKKDVDIYLSGFSVPAILPKFNNQ